MSYFKTNRTKNYSKSRKSKNKKQSEDGIIKVIEDRIIKDVKNLFGQEKQYYYKPVRVSNFQSKIILNTKVMVKELKHSQSKDTLMKLKISYLKDIIINLKKYDTWKIQLTIANDLVFSFLKTWMESVECIQNIGIMVYDRADKVIE